MITGVPRRILSDHLIHGRNILQIKNLYVYAAGFRMYEYEKDVLSEKDLFVKDIGVHGRDTRKATRETHPIYGTVRGQKSFQNVNVSSWSHILWNIKTPDGPNKPKINSCVND